MNENDLVTKINFDLISRYEDFLLIWVLFHDFFNTINIIFPIFFLIIN